MRERERQTDRQTDLEIDGKFSKTYLQLAIIKLKILYFLDVDVTLDLVHNQFVHEI